MAECSDVHSGYESGDESAGDFCEKEEVQYEILTILANGNAFE